MTGRRTVLLHSWHSQVVPTVDQVVQERDVGVLFCVDGHLDLHITTEKGLDLLPTKLLRLAEERSAAHFGLRRVTGELPILIQLKEREKDVISQAEMHLATPFGMIGADAERVLEFAPASLFSDDRPVAGGEMLLTRIEKVVECYQRLFGVLIHPSPPQRLAELLPRIKYEDVMFDIDVDYFHETQSECYTPIQNVVEGELGHIAQMLHLIKKVKPPVVTISEATKAALDNPASAVNSFLMWLKRRGYSIEHRDVFDDDEEARKTLLLYEKYWRTVRKPLISAFRFDESKRRHHFERVKRETANFFSKHRV